MDTYEVEAKGSEAKHIIDLLKAEADGRLVVLPVNIGDKVLVDSKNVTVALFTPIRPLWRLRKLQSYRLCKN